MEKLGSFQDPYSGELLVSALARTVASGEIDTRPLRRLLGVGSIRPAMVIPLRRLMAILPRGHRYDARKLLWKHTTGAFHFPFLGAEFSYLAAGAHIDDLLQGTRFRHQVLGVKVPFRICRHCLNDDRRRCGEAFWHREHHLLGVPICPTHQLPLMVGDTKLQAELRGGFRTLENVIRSGDSSSWSPLRSIDPLLSQYLSQWSKWLLENCESIAGYANLLLAYRSRFRGSDARSRSVVMQSVEAACHQIWGVTGRQTSRHIARWFGPRFRDVSLSASDLSPVSHLLVCRALQWTPAEAVECFPEGAESRNPLRPQGHIDNELTSSGFLYGFETTLDEVAARKRTGYHKSKFKGDPEREWIPRLARMLEQRDVTLVDFGQRHKNLNFTVSRDAGAQESETPVNDDGLEYRDEIFEPIQPEERENIQRAAEWLRLKEAPNAALFSHSTLRYCEVSTLQVIAAARDFLLRFSRGGKVGRRQMRDEEVNLGNILETEAPLWYHCEFRPRLLLMKEVKE